jgi:hypothetical protein
MIQQCLATKIWGIVCIYIYHIIYISYYIILYICIIILYIIIYNNHIDSIDSFGIQLDKKETRWNQISCEGNSFRRSSVAWMMVLESGLVPENEVATNTYSNVKKTLKKTTYDQSWAESQYFSWLCVHQNLCLKQFSQPVLHLCSQGLSRVGRITC